MFGNFKFGKQDESPKEESTSLKQFDLADKPKASIKKTVTKTDTTKSSAVAKTSKPAISNTASSTKNDELATKPTTVDEVETAKPETKEETLAPTEVDEKPKTDPEPEEIDQVETTSADSQTDEDIQTPDPEPKSSSDDQPLQVQVSLYGQPVRKLYKQGKWFFAIDDILTLASPLQVEEPITKKKDYNELYAQFVKPYGGVGYVTAKEVMELTRQINGTFPGPLDRWLKESEALPAPDPEVVITDQDS